MVCPSDLLSSEMALRGSPLCRDLPPNSLVASKDLWPGTYLARERQKRQRPPAFLRALPDDDWEAAAGEDDSE